MRSRYLALALIGVWAPTWLIGCATASSPSATLVPTHALPGAATDPAPGDPLTTDAPTPFQVDLPAETTPAPLATQPAPTPSPTPPPHPVWVGPGVPPPLAQAVADFAATQSHSYALTADPTLADVRIDSVGGDGTVVSTWVYVLAAPFPTLADGVTMDDLRGAWGGNPSGPFAGRPLLMTEQTLAALQGVLGQAAPGAVATAPQADLLTQAWVNSPAWAILPFEALEPRWKVLRIDDLSPLERGLDLAVYPLVAPVRVDGLAEVVEPFLAAVGLAPTNRDESRMTVVVMTGVTALTRATAWRMEGKGLTYPGEAVGPWLREADITHVSNEVSFDPECGPPNPVQEGVLFCSDPRYITLLEDMGVDVVEMTGNHIGDHGIENIEPTLDMYMERGWQYFGGGRNLDDARQPAIFEHNGNRIAFLGCNAAGPGWVWATNEHAGATPCEDYAWLYAQLAELRGQGVLPIVTLQYWEEDRYDPTPQQVVDFQALTDAGAVIVSGSHAHHVQGFGFHAGGLIHFGVGNLFFDQMEIMGNRQEFIDRHVFYGGRHVSTEVLTALLEDWSRPRPMTPEERRDLLQTVFAVSVWE